MVDRTCSVDGCGGKYVARGYCGKHYQRLTRTVCSIDGCERRAPARKLCATHYKQIYKVTGALPVAPAEERFWAKVDKTEACWNWTGAIAKCGYGYIGVNGASIRVHRFAYELANGPCSQHLDHICHNTVCVRPSHLRPVTPKQNGENRAKANRNSRSGVRGVCWYPSRNCWIARVKHNYKPIHVGYFATIEEAEEAVIAKRKELFTHNDVDHVPS